MSRFPRKSRAPRPHAKGRRAWGISDRGGQREYLRNLIEDGQYPGLRVTHTEWDPRHPQEFAIVAVDAAHLENPSPERDTPDMVVYLPAPSQEYPGEEGSLPVAGTVTGKLTAQALGRELGTLEGIACGTDTGTLTPEVISSIGNAFAVGLASGTRAGTLLAWNGGSEPWLAGLESGARVGTLTAEAERLVDLTGLAVGSEVGTTTAVSPNWADSFVGVQYFGASPLAREQRQ